MAQYSTKWSRGLINCQAYERALPGVHTGSRRLIGLTCRPITGIVSLETVLDVSTFLTVASISASIARMVLWPALVVVIVVVASCFPTQQTANLRIRQALAYAPKH